MGRASHMILKAQMHVGTVSHMNLKSQMHVGRASHMELVVKIIILLDYFMWEGLPTWN